MGKIRQHGTTKNRTSEGMKMQLQKLSFNVNRRANRSVRRIITGLCAAAGLIILGIILFYTVRNNSERVQLYSSQISSKMAQKAALVDALAAGAPLGGTEEEYYDYVDALAALYDDVSAVYVCVEQDGVVYQDGIMTYMSGGWVPDEDFLVTERAWYSEAAAMDDVYVSEPYADEQTGNICVTLSRAVYQDGDVVGVAGLDMYMDDLVTLIEASYDGGSYVFLTTQDGLILTHPDEAFALNETMEKLEHYITEITDTVKAISEKNLDFDVSGVYAGDYEKIKNALVDIVEALNGSFAQINEQAEMVLHFSKDLSATSESVATAATTQSWRPWREWIRP